MNSIDKLTVKYHGEIVGVISLTPDDKRLAFEYDPRWLAEGFSISPLELPLKTGLFLVATENIMLAAHAMGLGTEWMGIYPQKEIYELLKDLLELPDNIKAFGMIAVGHSAEHPAPKDKWDADKVHYEKW